MTTPYGSDPQNQQGPGSGGFPQQPNPYQTPQGGVPQPYGQPGYGVPVVPLVPQVPNNGLAITSMVVSLVGIVTMCLWGIGFILAILGVIFGHVAKGQIQRDGTRGGGMATAGLVIGYVIIGFFAVGILLFAIGAASFSTIPFMTN